MSQRIATAAAVVAAAACVGMFVFMWQSSAANRAMLQQSQQMNSELLEQMQGLAVSLSAGRSEDNRPAEWNQLQVRCVADSEDGSPLEGVRVHLESASENTVGIPPATLTTDGDGLVDFGQVLYGQYTVSLTAPNEMRMRQQISVRPGHDTLETFVCPAGDGLAELQLEPQFEGEAAPPESLRDRIWFLVALVRESSPSIWSRPIGDPSKPEIIHCLCSANGELIAVDERHRNATSVEGASGLFARVTESIWMLPEDAVPRDALFVVPGYYSIGEGAVCLVDEDDPSGRTFHQILIPDLKYGRVGDDPRKVAWGQANSLTFPFNTTVFAMLSRILEAAPHLELAKLRVRADIGSGRNRDDVPPAFGGRVAISLSVSGRVSASTARRGFGFRDDTSTPEPLLTGVEVISFRPDWSSRPEGFGGSPQFHQLVLLCTPQERTFLQSLSNSRIIHAAPVDMDTERTSLDPSVKAQLLEELDSAAAESE